MFFSQKTSSSRKAISENAIGKFSKDIGEYHLLKFMWKEFGIKPHELEDYDQEWVNKMAIISNAEGEAQEKEFMEMEQKSKSKNPSNFIRGR